MAGRPAADPLILRGVLLPAGIAGDGVGDAVHMLEYALHAPKAPAGEDGRLGRLLARRRIRGRRGDGTELLREAGCKAERAGCRDSNGDHAGGDGLPDDAGHIIAP
jgi:hypothetical protein